MDERFSNEDVDFLPIKIDQQFFFEKNNINYITIESFYDQSYQNVLDSVFIPKIKEWLTQSDKSIYTEKRIEHSFSSNGFWFMHKFLDLFFIQNCVDKLMKQYSTIEIITDKKIKKLGFSTLSLSDLSFSNILGQGSDRFISLLIYSLPNTKIIEIKKKFQIKNIFYHLYSKSIWLYLGIIRKSRELLNKYSNLKKKENIFLYLQEGYDLNIIKNHSSKTQFLNIKNRIIQKLEKVNLSEKIYSQETIRKDSKVFFSNFLPSFETLLTNLVDEYVLASVNVINNFPKKELSFFKNKKVNGIILPMCAQDLIDFNVVRTANKLNIPVYFFKHNGPIEIFRYNDPFVLFLEQNKFLNRLQFIHSDFEKQSMENISTLNLEVVRHLGINYKDETNKQKNKKILYAVGSPSRYTLKDLRGITFDNEKLTFLNALIDYSIETDSIMSIKAHPRGYEELSNMLIEMKRGIKDPSKITLIHHKKIEELFNRYDLIVSDTLFSSVVSNALYTNKNILVFCPRKECIAHKNYDLLCKRVTLVHDLSELKRIINNLEVKGLRHENDPEFIDSILGTLTYSEAIDKILKTMISK